MVKANEATLNSMVSMMISSLLVLMMLMKAQTPGSESLSARSEFDFMSKVGKGDVPLSSRDREIQRSGV